MTDAKYEYRGIFVTKAQVGMLQLHQPWFGQPLQPLKPPTAVMQERLKAMRVFIAHPDGHGQLFSAHNTADAISLVRQPTAIGPQPEDTR